MYQVISIRVIRQVLDWMGIPSPWFRTVDFFGWPDGRRTSTVKCMWNFEDLSDWYHGRLEAVTTYPQIYTPEQIGRVLWGALAECFCDDIQVVRCRYEPGAHQFVAYLTCTVIPKDAICMGEMPSWSYDPERLDL